MMKQAVVTTLLILAAHDIYAINWEENPKVGELFNAAGVRGTFVLYDAEAGRFTGHNRRRAQRRYLPASTFKIPNTLIGLAVGAVNDVDQVLPYGEKPQPISEWEQDMSLRQAIKISNVPVYQELARRIGLDRMRRSVAKLGFSNGSIGTAVDTFWLVGPLKISAVEQAEFLCRLARNQLLFSKDSQAKTREITFL